MEDASRLRRRDTSKGPPLRVLSLDGGGVRGYSMFVILQQLMHKTYVEIHGKPPSRHELPKPCDHFDLIGGTGTGGLIAIMLGRLRMDIETCKDVYVRMTRRVFQTDKTFAGIPYKSTLFKASKLEEVIKECVRDHTVFDDEGNDALSNAVPMTPDLGWATPGSARSSSVPQRSMSQGSRYSQVGRSPTGSRASLSFGSVSLGNPNAQLFDSRENRTKTAVTAVFQGARGAESEVLLRSYDSRKESAPENSCTIWQAGRATSATGLAFKPIQIGQSTFHDDGAGKFNPAPRLLDEAVQNEWPGRDIGVFVSIGTGKRPGGNASNESEWWSGFLGGTMGAFAEARKRLIAKIEGCEDTHLFMLRQHLAARGVTVENYFRFNVEVGVGEFAMNEWNRLGDISTNTRMYLSKGEVQYKIVEAAQRLAKVHSTNVRRNRTEAQQHLERDPQQQAGATAGYPGHANDAYAMEPAVAELAGDEPEPGFQQYSPNRVYEHRPSIADQKYIVAPDSPTFSPSSTQASYQTPQQSPRVGFANHEQARDDTQHGRFPTRQSTNPGQTSSPPRQNAPPLPPKMPLPYPDYQPLSTVQSPQQGHADQRTSLYMGDMGRSLPYPDMDAPPPAVNTANKPQIRP